MMNLKEYKVFTITYKEYLDLGVSDINDLYERYHIISLFDHIHGVHGDLVLIPKLQQDKVVMQMNGI